MASPSYLSRAARFMLYTLSVPAFAHSRALTASRVLASSNAITMRAQAPRMALPSLPTIAAVCTLPTCVGFWKSEYGVSYAYGGATAIMGALVLRAAPTPLAAAHAAAVLVYGVRLNAFLLWRELNIPRFREFREKVEARAVSAGGRLKRTPFVLSCAALYACLAAPAIVTSSTAATGVLTTALVGVAGRTAISGTLTTRASRFCGRARRSQPLLARLAAAWGRSLPTAAG